jgi:predicted ATP-dependent serine protease
MDDQTYQCEQDYEAEMERLASEAEEEAIRLAQEIAETLPMEQEAEEYTAEDYERDIEFGRLEAARDEHLAMLKRTDAEKAKYPPFDYLVDGLLPVNEVHIIAGETGAGKSTWLFDNFINPWQHEKPVLGRKSRWLPYVIFVNDRSEAGMIRTLQRLELHPKQFPIKSTITGGKTTLAQKIEAFHDANPALKVVFIEGLHVGQKEGNDYGQSSEVMQELNGLCQKRKLTIVATTHISKANAQLGGLTERRSSVRAQHRECVKQFSC